MSGESATVKKLPFWSDLFLTASLTLLAFLLCWQSGRRGFFPFDQSIVFDGGYRVLTGQRVYRDFVVPTGPVAYWLQAVYFFIGGVNYKSYLANAAIGNCIAALCALFILKRCIPSARVVPYVGAFLTAIWFYPPSGTAYIEQTAFLIVLLSTALIVSSMSLVPEPGRLVAVFLTGMFAGLAFLTKQNAGLAALPLLVGLIVVSGTISWRAVLTKGTAFLIGMVFLGLTFWLWLYLFSDYHRFWNHFWVIPSKEGIRRLAGTTKSGLPLQILLPLNLITGPGPIPCRLAMVLSNMAMALVIVISFLNPGKGGEWRRELTASYLGLGMSLAQSLFDITTNNQSANNLPYIGLVVAIGIAATLRLLRMSLFLTDDGNPIPLPGPKVMRSVTSAAYVLLVCWVGWAGYQVGRERPVQEFKGASFSAKCDVPILEYVKWSNNSEGKGQFTPGQIEAVVRLLKEKDKRFMVFSDCTILYAILNKPAPQPFLWFHQGLTYPRAYEENLDRWFLDSLKRQQVELVLLEDNSWYDAGTTLANFPLVKQYIDEQFSQLPKIGGFRIYEWSASARMK